MIVIDRPDQLNRALIDHLSRTADRIALSPALLAALAASRDATVASLATDRPVYGVNTGMGAMAGVRLTAEAQSRQQNTLMIGRAVGSAPWLTPRQSRALLAARLRTLLHPAAGASPDLCLHLVAVLNTGVVPAVPARGGAAGEIIPLAHAGAALNGTGQVLDPTGNAVDAAPALRAAGLEPRPFAPKEGVAFLEGVPGLTALASLAAADTRILLTQVTLAAAAAHAVIGAGPDPLHPALADSPELAEVLTTLRTHLTPPDTTTPTATGPHRTPHAPAAAGPELTPHATAATGPELTSHDPAATGPERTSHDPAATGPLPAGAGGGRALQAPLSFRVAAPAIAVAMRAVGAVEEAADRALSAVTDSPAHLDGRFVGTFGFAGTDLVAAAGALTTALVHLAELGTARLHRLLDDRLTGRSRQLSDSPGLHAGMVTVHKRAVGVTHRLRRFAAPALLGTMETSLGQEDVQSFGFEAAECLTEALTGLRDVLACELLAVHQAILLGGSPPPLSGSATTALTEITATLPAGTADRPFGRDLDQLIQLLQTRPASQWTNDV